MKSLLGQEYSRRQFGLFLIKGGRIEGEATLHPYKRKSPLMKADFF
jgi:hypothetical protein